MFQHLVPVVLCLFAAAAGQDDMHQFPKGISSGPFFVRAVHKNGLTVQGDGDFSARKKIVKLTVTKDTQIELVDMAVEDGKPTARTKRIALADLFPEQPISVIFFSDGKQLTLLRAVAAGERLSGRDLAATVKKLGGTAKRATWLKDQIAIIVDLRGAKITDADLAALSQTHGIADLDLSFTAVTDKGVASLAGYPKLSSLHLTGTKVTDAAIGDLRRLPDLSHLNVAQTDITAAGVAKLVDKKSFFTLCQAALGDKARFRVFQEFRAGQLQFNYLMINDTYYGRYYVEQPLKIVGESEPDRRREATTYYHRLGPVGQVMGKLEWFTPASTLDYPSDVRMPASLLGLSASPGPLPTATLVHLWSEPPLAVVRLNAGTHAAYGRPYQCIHFYNSSPELTTFSLPPRGQPAHFGFIRDALQRGCDIRIIDGAERTTIAVKAPRKFYRAWFVDVTRNDLRDINTALLTKEALADMVDCLVEKGIVCYHTSHRYHNLIPAIVDAANALKLSWKVVNDVPNYRARNVDSHFGSEWVMVARRAEYLQHLQNVKSDERRLDWTVPASTGKHLWRDGQAHDLGALARPAGN